MYIILLLKILIIDNGHIIDETANICDLYSSTKATSVIIIWFFCDSLTFFFSYSFFLLMLSNMNCAFKCCFRLSL